MPERRRPAPLATTFLARGLAVWALTRLAVSFVLLLAGANSALALAPAAALLMVGVSAALGHVDVARRGERAMLGNFGVSRARLTAWLALPALAGEAAVAALLGALARDGCAVVATGHEVPTLFAAADQVTWCTGGMTYELGAPAAARGHHDFRREYLGPRAD